MLCSEYQVFRDSLIELLLLLPVDMNQRLNSGFFPNTAHYFIRVFYIMNGHSISLQSQAGYKYKIELSVLLACCLL